MLHGRVSPTPPPANREVKFVVSLAQAAEIRAWARDRLLPDPHASEGAGDEYRTATLYSDTPAFDICFRRKPFSRSKYRIRRYGGSDSIFAERKLRTADRVLKCRTRISLDTLHDLAAGRLTDFSAAYWFQQRVAARRLQPACQVTYRRVARVGPADGGSAAIRLTLDTDVAALAVGAFEFHRRRGLPVLDGLAILELKFRGDVPSPFDELIATFALQPSLISKYRWSMERLGRAGAIPQWPALVTPPASLGLAGEAL